MQFQNLQADIWVFDNDGTLYSNPKELEDSVEILMNQFLPWAATPMFIVNKI